MLFAAVLLASGQSKQPQPLIRLGGPTSAGFVCMAAHCLISAACLDFFDLGDCVFPGVCYGVFSSCLVFIEQFLLLSKGPKN